MKKLPLFLLGLLAGIIPTAFAATIFTDVDESAWYAEAVQSLTDKGIIKGYDDGTFKPSDNVNRAELAVTLNRLLDYLDPGESTYPLSKIEVGGEIPAESDGFAFMGDTYTDYYFRDGDILYLTAGYGGGCDSHDFQLMWDGTFKDTGHASLYLIHDAHNESCRNTETKILKFDLSTIRKSYESMFGVAEGNVQVRIYNNIAEGGSSITVDYSF